MDKLIKTNEATSFSYKFERKAFECFVNWKNVVVNFNVHHDATNLVYVNCCLKFQFCLAFILILILPICLQHSRHYDPYPGYQSSSSMQYGFGYGNEENHDLTVL